MGTTTAKVKATAKEAVEVLSGYPGIFRHLAGEHSEVATLMKKVAGSSEGSTVREELFPEIRKKLLAHTKAEEQEFYDPLRRHPETEDLIAQATEEHEKVEGYLDELTSGNKATKTWMKIFERMRRAVEAHVDMEENDIFPAAREVLSAEEAQEMEKRYQALEEQVKQRL